MLQMEIQASKEPCSDWAVPVEIKRHLGLMHGPWVLHGKGSIGQGMVRAACAVGKLKYHGNGQTHDEDNDGIVEEDRREGMITQRKREREYDKKDFSSDKDRKVPALWPRHPVRVYPACDDMMKIAVEMEFEHEQGIEHPDVEVLPSMKRQSFLMRCKTGKDAEVYVWVMPRDVHVVVMKHGVFPMPDVGTRADEVQCHCGEPVYPSVL